MTKNIDKDMVNEKMKDEALEEENLEEQVDETSTEDEQEETTEEKPAQDEEDMNTKYMRLMADFQNFKKRSEKQKSDIYAFANEKIVLKLIDVLDNFERALEAEATDQAFKDGMEMIFKQLKDVLTENGVTEVETEDVLFDPNFHNAVMMEDTDKVESGKVSEVLQKGYILNERVIRPAMVKVAN